MHPVDYSQYFPTQIHIPPRLEPLEMRILQWIAGIVTIVGIGIVFVCCFIGVLSLLGYKVTTQPNSFWFAWQNNNMLILLMVCMLLMFVCLLFMFYQRIYSAERVVFMHLVKHKIDILTFQKEYVVMVKALSKYDYKLLLQARDSLETMQGYELVDTKEVLSRSSGAHSFANSI